MGRKTPNYLLTHLLTYSLTYLLTYLLTYPLIGRKTPNYLPADVAVRSAMHVLPLQDRRSADIFVRFAAVADRYFFRLTLDALGL